MFMELAAGSMPLDHRPPAVSFGEMPGMRWAAAPGEEPPEEGDDEEDAWDLQHMRPHCLHCSRLSVPYTLCPVSCALYPPLKVPYALVVTRGTGGGLLECTMSVGLTCEVLPGASALAAPRPALQPPECALRSVPSGAPATAAAVHYSQPSALCPEPCAL